MNKNKLCIILISIITCIMTFTNVFGVEIYDTKIEEEIYKTSEDVSEFGLPFIRVSGKRMDIDNSISQSGIFISSSTIDVNANLKGIQLFVGNDTIRINSDIQNSIICNNGNVILNGTVEENLLIYCSGTITLTENANVKGNVICYSPEVQINSDLDGNVLGSVGKITINSIIKGQIRMNVNEIDFSDGSKVDGGIFLNTTNSNLKIAENIGTSTVDIIENQKLSLKETILNILSLSLNNIIMYLLVLIFFKSDKMNKLYEKLTNKNIIKSGIHTYIILLAMICLGIILLTVVSEMGISLIVASTAIMLIFTLLKDVLVGILFIRLIERKYNDSNNKPNNVLVAIVMFVLIELLESIPYIGNLISFMFFIIAIGVISLLMEKENNKQTEIIEVE